MPTTNPTAAPTAAPTKTNGAINVTGRTEALALAVFLADSGYTVDTKRVRVPGGMVLPSDTTLAERRAHDAVGRFEVSFYVAAEVSS